MTAIHIKNGSRSIKPNAGGYLFNDASKDDHMTSCLPKINLDARANILYIGLT